MQRSWRSLRSLGAFVCTACSRSITYYCVLHVSAWPTDVCLHGEATYLADLELICVGFRRWLRWWTPAVWSRREGRREERRRQGDGPLRRDWLCAIERRREQSSTPDSDPTAKLKYTLSYESVIGSRDNYRKYIYMKQIHKQVESGSFNQHTTMSVKLV